MKLDQYPEERLFKESGPWSKSTIDVLVPFYNEEENLRKVHSVNQRLERLFHIKNYIYVNNGSKDQTHQGLLDLQAQDPKIKIVQVTLNQGYGLGVKEGIKVATADYVLTNHADIQFEPFSFFLTHLDHLQSLPIEEAIFPVRVNRPRADSFLSLLLRVTASILIGRRVADFNGQPKLMPRARIQSAVESFPLDFSIDLALYLCFQPAEMIQLPILQAARWGGVSSWNKNPLGRLQQAWRHLKYILSISFFARKPTTPRASRTSDNRPRETP